MSNSEDTSQAAANTTGSRNHIYIIGNPEHPLGFMMVSHDDPLGFHNPSEVVFELGVLRKDAGRHLMLYRLELVEEAVVSRKEIEKYIAEAWFKDFDFSFVKEFILEGASTTKTENETNF